MTSISIVIPVFNEGANVEDVVLWSASELAQLTDEYEVLVVDDASTDATPTVLERLVRQCPGHVKTVRNQTNIGCHPSELLGFMAARGDLMFFIPGDKQILPSEIHKFLARIPEYDMIYSNRARRADSLSRRLVSRANNLFERALLGLDLRDSHSSVLVTREVVQAVAGEVKSRSAMIPLEMAYLARSKGFRIVEVDIEHHPRVAGIERGLALNELLKLPGDFARLWRTKQMMQGRSRGLSTESAG